MPLPHVTDAIMLAAEGAAIMDRVAAAKDLTGCPDRGINSADVWLNGVW
jgi:hypothetical protein